MLMKYWVMCMYDFDDLNEKIKHSEESILDFEYLMEHPQARFAIWQRYENDPVFQGRLDHIMDIDSIFKTNFRTCFSEYLPKEQGSR